MAHIAIFVGSIGAGENGTLFMSGDARLSTDGGTVSWSTEVAYNALASTIDDAIKSAAIAAAEAANYTVGALDKKLLFAGAVGL